VDKRFRSFDPHQVLLLPPSLDDWLPDDHLARFAADLVDDVLDLSPILADYTDKRGYPPYDPRLMLRLLIYGYTSGVRSSRAIEHKCADDVAFRFLAAGQAPDYRSIARFRRRHLDGTKLEANASKHRAMSYGRLIDKEERIEAEIAELEAKAAAEATDSAEDQAFGPDGKDTDLPAELDRRGKRLARLQAARAQIEAEAAEKARRHAADKERRRPERAGTSDEQVVTDAGQAAADKAQHRREVRGRPLNPPDPGTVTSEGVLGRCDSPGQAAVRGSGRLRGLRGGRGRSDEAVEGAARC
jgi:transposase